jgi:hypothetical protein
MQARQTSDKYDTRVVFAAYDREQITTPTVFGYATLVKAEEQ